MILILGCSDWALILLCATNMEVRSCWFPMVGEYSWVRVSDGSGVPTCLGFFFRFTSITISTVCGSNYAIEPCS
jgi:hypothetical protein